MICPCITLKCHSLYNTRTGTEINAKQRSKDCDLMRWIMNWESGELDFKLEIVMDYLINPKTSPGFSFPIIKEGVRANYFSYSSHI